jgi:hypothetical protein
MIVVIHHLSCLVFRHRIPPPVDVAERIACRKRTIAGERHQSCLVVRPLREMTVVVVASFVAHCRFA